MARCLRCQARSSATPAATSQLRPAVPFGPARALRHARTVALDDDLRTGEGGTWQTPLVACREPLGRCARPVRHKRRQPVAIGCRKPGVEPKVQPSMTSRRRATQEIHRERNPATHCLHLHDLPGRVLRLRLPVRPQPGRSPGHHSSRLRLRRPVPVRTELHLRQVLIRAGLKAVPAQGGTHRQPPTASGRPSTFGSPP